MPLPNVISSYEIMNLDRPVSHWKSVEYTSPNSAFVETCGGFSIGLLRNLCIFSILIIEKERGGDDEKYGEHIYIPKKMGRKSGAQKKKKIEKKMVGDYMMSNLNIEKSK